jgi:hypothetical protein
MWDVFLSMSPVVIAIVSTSIHPLGEDPSNHPLVFTEYANDDSWIALIGQFADGIMVFGGAFVALCRGFPSRYKYCLQPIFIVQKYPILLFVFHYLFQSSFSF